MKFPLLPVRARWPSRSTSPEIPWQVVNYTPGIRTQRSLAHRDTDTRAEVELQGRVNDADSANRTHRHPGPSGRSLIHGDRDVEAEVREHLVFRSDVDLGDCLCLGVGLCLIPLGTPREPDNLRARFTA